MLPSPLAPSSPPPPTPQYTYFGVGFCREADMVDLHAGHAPGMSVKACALGCGGRCTGFSYSPHFPSSGCYYYYNATISSTYKTRKDFSAWFVCYRMMDDSADTSTAAVQPSPRPPPSLPRPPTPPRAPLQVQPPVPRCMDDPSYEHDGRRCADWASAGMFVTFGCRSGGWGVTNQADIDSLMDHMEGFIATPVLRAMCCHMMIRRLQRPLKNRGVQR